MKFKRMRKLILIKRKKKVLGGEMFEKENKKEIFDGGEV